MQKIFSPEGHLYAGMERIYQVLMLNIVFLISCLPLVTIGAAITAAYGTAYKLIYHKEGVLYRTYLSQFKRNFISATKMWLSLLGVLAFGGLSLPYFRFLIIGNQIAYYLVMILLTFFILMSLYVFPLIARYENNLAAIVVNAMILSLKHLPISILVFLVTVGGLFAFPLYLPKLLFIWLFMGMGIVFFINGKLLLKIFEHYDNLEEGS